MLKKRGLRLNAHAFLFGRLSNILGDGIWREAFEHIRWNWKLYELFFI
jgi:hypothetical protein